LISLALRSEYSQDHLLPQKCPALPGIFVCASGIMGSMNGPIHHHHRRIVDSPTLAESRVP
jgi:hypothetical protein